MDRVCAKNAWHLVQAPPTGKMSICSHRATHGCKFTAAEDLIRKASAKPGRLFLSLSPALSLSLSRSFTPSSLITMEMSRSLLSVRKKAVMSLVTDSMDGVWIAAARRIFFLPPLFSLTERARLIFV